MARRVAPVLLVLYSQALQSVVLLVVLAGAALAVLGTLVVSAAQAAG